MFICSAMRETLKNIIEHQPSGKQPTTLADSATETQTTQNLIWFDSHFKFVTRNLSAPSESCW